MLECYVCGQSLKLYTPVIAADSLHYLTGLAHFSGSDWDGHSVWLHFRKGGRGDGGLRCHPRRGGRRRRGQGRSISRAGSGRSISRQPGRGGGLTTVPVMLTVKASGLVDAPLHPMPLSVAEQVSNEAAAALACARELKAAAEAGASTAGTAPAL